MTTLPANSARTDAAPAEACAREAVLCTHCSLPVPPGLIQPGESTQFCCHGCQTVFALLGNAGLDGYYRVRDAADAGPGIKGKDSAESFTEFDDPTFLDKHAVPMPGGLMRATLLLEGVHCAACVWLIERLPRLAEGVSEARLDMRRGTVAISWNPAETTLSRVAAKLDQIGYRPHAPRLGARQAIQKAQDHAFLVRLGVAGAIAGNAMLVAISLYAGAFDGMDPFFTGMFRWIGTILGVLSLVWPGRVFFTGAIGALRARAPHLDIPIALALFVGGIWSVVATVGNTGETYFDSLATLVFALLVGRYLQHTRQRRAIESVELLHTLTPSHARRIETIDGVEETRRVAIETVEIDDMIEVHAGEPIPADGVVTLGDSEIDASMLSGESRAVAIMPGDEVAAGAINLSSTIRVRVSATGEETRVGRLMGLVADAAGKKAHIIQIADRVAGWFVVVAGGLALLTFFLWLHEGVHVAVEHATALLIVTCPCALGLAAPLVFTVEIGRLAQRGIFIKSGAALEQLAKPLTFVLDKTGTITHGGLRVTRWVGDDSIRPLVAAIERDSAHPVAEALREAGDDDALELIATDVQTTIGGGIRGTVNGRTLLVGSASMLAREGVSLDPEFVEFASGGARAGESTVFIADLTDDRRTCIAAASLCDTLREDTAAVVATLRSMNERIELLSGDRSDVAQRIAEQAGIDPDHVIGEATPEQKLERIRSLTADSTRSVVMVGDGVNDAAALAAADVGIAVRGGAEASLEAGDVYLRHEGVGPILDLTKSAQGAMRRVRLCMLASLTYNSTAAILAIAGFVGPLTAAILMPLSSFTVLAIAIGRTDKARKGTTP